MRAFVAQTSTLRSTSRSV